MCLHSWFQDICGIKRCLWSIYLLNALDNGVLGSKRQFLNIFDEDLFTGSLNSTAENQKKKQFHSGQTGFGIRIAAKCHRIRKPHQNQLTENIL